MRRLGELWERDALRSLTVARQIGYVLACELRSHGVDMSFTPVLDRAAYASVGPLLSDQHQVFGHMDGTLVLDDGSKITLKRFMAFAEKVHNKW